MTLQARSSWDSTFSFSISLSEELRFWFCNIEAFNGYAIQPKLCPGVVIFCDANDYAFGGFQVKLNDHPVSGMFSPFERVQSSTFRELKAIFYVIKAHVLSLRHKKVKVFTDNENASRIVSFGSSKQHLQSVAVDIFHLCLDNDIQIDAQWIPRDANVRADLLSRHVDRDDWSLNSEVFGQLDRRWGPHSVDRFASHYNAQVSRFNSKFMSPASAAQSMLCPEIGRGRTIGFVLLFR